MFPPGIEPGTFRVLGGCDNHYTTETVVDMCLNIPIQKNFEFFQIFMNLYPAHMKELIIILLQQFYQKAIVHSGVKKLI